MFESCRPDHKENKGLDVKSRPFFRADFCFAQHYAQHNDSFMALSSVNLASFINS